MTAPPEIFSEGVGVGSALKPLLGSAFVPDRLPNTLLLGTSSQICGRCGDFCIWGSHSTDTLQQFLLRSSAMRVASFPVRPDKMGTIRYVTLTELPQQLTLIFDGA
jgi:hypothetical protein